MAKAVNMPSWRTKKQGEAKRKRKMATDIYKYHSSPRHHWGPQFSTCRGILSKASDGKEFGHFHVYAEFCGIQYRLMITFIFQFKSTFVKLSVKTANHLKYIVYLSKQRNPTAT